LAFNVIHPDKFLGRVRETKRDWKPRISRSSRLGLRMNQQTAGRNNACFCFVS
jgi:hypothetical protein